MKAALARSWKTLSSKIHPPLPLTPRESQQLLSLLDASFKKQLDRQHQQALSSNEQHADLHVRSILTNPLFNTKPRTHATSNNKRQHIDQCLEQLQNRIKSPIDSFKERVSRGTADLKSAKFCLKIQHRACFASAAPTRKQAMQTSQTASTLLQWLWSSGIEDTGTFLKDLDFIDLLVPFLVAEGYQSRISRWLIRCLCPGETPFSSLRGLDTQDIQSSLFCRMIQGEERFGGGLESAMSLFVRTTASTTACLRSHGQIRKSAHRGIIDAAWFLTLKIHRLPSGAEPAPSISQAFVETMTDVTADPLLLAHLSVFVVKPPRPQPALEYLQAVSPSSAVFRSKQRRPYIILLGLRLAELFLHDGCHTEALWIMDFLQERYPLDLDPQPPPIHRYKIRLNPEKLVQSEERSLHWLDKLATQ